MLRLGFCGCSYVLLSADRRSELSPDTTSHPIHLNTPNAAALVSVCASGVKADGIRDAPGLRS